MAVNFPVSKSYLSEITRNAVSAAKQAADEKAKEIIRHAFEQIKIEVAAGRSHALAMSLRLGTDIEITNRASSGRIDASTLNGVAARVWHALTVFAPTLEYWSREEGDQRESYTIEGYNIILHWTDCEDLLARVQKLDEQTLRNELARIIAESQNAIEEKAVAILKQLKNRAYLQAKAGKDWAIVMSLTSGKDFEPQGASAKSLSPDALGPVAKAVWDSCAEFWPTLEYWSREEGDQRESYTAEGFNIVIHW